MDQITPRPSYLPLPILEYYNIENEQYKNWKGKKQAKQQKKRQTAADLLGSHSLKESLPEENVFTFLWKDSKERASPTSLTLSIHSQMYYSL